MDRTPLSESAARSIIELIISGEYGNGDKIPNEMKLAQKFEMSRSTVREAVKTLVSQNILEIRRGQGTFVCQKPGLAEDPLGFRFINDKLRLAVDLIEIRLLIEPHIAGAAAKNASTKEIEGIVEQCDAVEKLILLGEPYGAEDVAFHKKIAVSSKNLVVPNLVPVINSTIHVSIDVTRAALRDETIATHRAIARAIEERNGEAARSAMTEHILYNQKLVKKLRSGYEAGGPP
ncbi:MAG: FadR family transcriptional regulator [Spirochaetaceae bacterium]|jgi:DNA-binding FadR family transcriptional regulator|nr:FadR family transcriptional regulator [Spirochaetaceae bacterium]